MPTTEAEYTYAVVPCMTSAECLQKGGVHIRTLYERMAGTKNPALIGDGRHKRILAERANLLRVGDGPARGAVVTRARECQCERGCARVSVGLFGNRLAAYADRDIGWAQWLGITTVVEVEAGDWRNHNFAVASWVRFSTISAPLPVLSATHDVLDGHKRSVETSDELPL